MRPFRIKILALVNSSRGLKALIAVALIQAGGPALASQVQLRNAEVYEGKVEAILATDKSKAEGLLKLNGFIQDLEKILDKEHSVAPVQQLFQKYFPLTGCDADSALELCRKSRYFSAVTKQGDTIVVAFESTENPHSGIYLQFSIDQRSGNSSLPFVKIKI